MESTGMIRRIDDIGRIVIPTEIRSRLGLSEGQPMEVLLRDEEVVLRRYSPLATIEALASKYAQMVYEKTGFGCCITDRNRVLAAIWPVDPPIDPVLGEVILPEAVRQCMETGKSIVVPRSGEAWPYSWWNGVDYVAAPVFMGTECVGSVVLVDASMKFRDPETKEPIHPFGMFERMYAELVAGALEVRLEG